MENSQQAVMNAFKHPARLLCVTLLLLSGCHANAAPNAGDAGRASESSASPGARARTSSSLSAADLRTRLFALAHDTMMGRSPGDPGDFKAAAYIASEFQRVGLKPAGDNGT